MNKTLLSTAFVAGLAVVAIAPQAARATDGTINFTGAVTAKTCTVKVNGGSASPAAVTLPTVSTSSLNAVGATAGQTQFSINLSACSTATTAATYFEAGPTVNSNGRLNNTAGTGAATGVDLQLVNSDNSLITVGSAAPTTGAGVATITGSAATLNYFARYYATTATVGAGTVTSSVNFSMIYN